MRSRARTLLLAARLCHAADRRTFFLAVALQLIAGAGVVLMLLAGQRVLAGLLRDDTVVDDPARVGLAVAVLAASAALTGIASGLQAGRQRLLIERTVRHVGERVLEVGSSVPLTDFEDAAFHDRLTRAERNSLAALQTTMALIQLVGGLFMSLGALVVIGRVDILLVPMVLAVYVPLWLAVSRNSESLFDFSYGQTPDDRGRQVLTAVLLGRPSAAEVRTFDLGGFLGQRWRDLYEVRIRAIRQTIRDNDRRTVLASVVSGALLGGTIAALAWMVATDRVTLAAAAIAAVAIQQLGARLTEVGAGVGQLAENALFLEDYNRFLSDYWNPRSSVDVSVEQPTFDSLELRSVAFRYPTGSSDALRGVSLEVRRGEVVAIVGESGAGKTTLIKLLLGLYRPTGGEVLFNGANLADVPESHRQKTFSAIFQDYVRLPLTARDNVVAGDWRRSSDDAVVVAALGRAGLYDLIASWPNGIDTMMSPMFEGGVDVSTGQWQRVALARALFRDAPVLVLDEPTAALDPITERALFDEIRQMFVGRTIILVSHRFATVRSADRIFVVQDGRVAEQGTHDTLIGRRGLYFELFTTQAEAFFGTAQESTPVDSPSPSTIPV